MENIMEDTQQVINTRDMLNQALESNPSQMGQTMNDLLMAKVMAAVQDRKIEVAQTMFADNDADEEEISDDEELEQQEDEDENENT